MAIEIIKTTGNATTRYTLQSIPTSKRFRNLTGETFGRLTVVGFIKIQHNHSLWLCRCECGDLTTAWAHNLTERRTKSCGSAACKVASRQSDEYGMDPVFAAMNNAKQRCQNPNHPQYRRYGARGITFDFATVTQAVEYITAHLGPRPEGYVIDRIDNAKGYAPGNLRWASPKESAANRDITLWITVFGQHLTVVEAAERFNIPYSTLKSRLADRWDVVDAVSIPKMRRGRQRKTAA